ncbi:unnamed protein product [Rotaria socialis]|uniref:Coiled-coil domain-containing protein 93 n=1 Tax=Rotaria socialis TaxID=392032 RepID=A0A818SLD9_9BILA|nr:unnamed protein product [Rotaria socialis]CAF3809352.1 unnamed protein product [Rotaria socialis]CAF4566862.1 unnamed protein product [Rotaria socialis]CAF4634295.1 unnamed protein product [Rotaria socialis]
MAMLGKFDVREDPEQKAKCDETMELLLAAGYFRVRIKGLSDFDKVVGGLAWSIQACNFAVDIDVLYQENATLGQKLELTERIILVLSRMKCSHRIEPHQIQGEDFIHIFPVVQWLVKRVFERRADIGDLNRAYALNQYDKQFNEAVNDTESMPFKEHIQDIRIRHRPKRRFRCLDSKKKQLNNTDERRKRVHSTLVEFGQMHQLLNTSAGNEKPEQDVDALIKNMVDEKSKIATQIVNSLVTQQQDTLRGIIEDFEEKEKARLEEALLSEGGQQQLAIRTFKVQLNKQLERIGKLQKDIDELQNRKEQTKNSALEVKEQYEKLREEIEEIERQTENVDPEALKRVEALVADYETTKKEENERRTLYKDEKTILEEELEKLQARLNASSDIDTPENEKMKQIQEQYQAVSDRIQSQRLVMAKKVREISALSRRIDDIPSSNELAQYRQAFFQLFNQSAVLYRQTKQNYTLYNTFTDMIDYMTKEIKLIESIHEGYPQAIGSSSSREHFLKQLESIAESVKQSRMKIEQRQQKEKSKRDTLKIQFAQLIEKARQYAKVLKDFQEAIRENEHLTSKPK